MKKLAGCDTAKQNIDKNQTLNEIDRDDLFGKTQISYNYPEGTIMKESTGKIIYPGVYYPYYRETNGDIGVNAAKKNIESTKNKNYNINHTVSEKIVECHFEPTIIDGKKCEICTECGAIRELPVSEKIVECHFEPTISDGKKCEICTECGAIRELPPVSEKIEEHHFEPIVIDVKQCYIDCSKIIKQECTLEDLKQIKNLLSYYDYDDEEAEIRDCDCQTCDIEDIQDDEEFQMVISPI